MASPAIPRNPDLAAPVRAALVVGLLYVFLVGVGLLEAGISTFGSGFETRFLAQVSHPMAGLAAGILATVLVQSSSVSTATIVGLVGAGTLTLPLAVPMIMGANIGTTVTSTLAALGSLRNRKNFQRAFAGATMHDMFNLLAVTVLLPLELSTRVLSRSATWLTELLRGTEISAPGKSPIRTAVKFPVGLIEDAVSAGGFAGVFAALTLLTLGLVAIFFALATITKNMRQLVAGNIERSMNKLVGQGGGTAGIGVGLVVTVAVQSSTITTSILVPLVAVGVLTLRNAFPITLGANIGTTITALLASLAVSRPEGLAIALVHTLFNVVALIVIYPIPAIRWLPVRAASWFATRAANNRLLVLVYVAGVFILLPLMLIVVFD
ncbi:MAG: Na/Pi symporter [Nitriliruptoraceae bacterium]